MLQKKKNMRLKTEKNTLRGEVVILFLHKGLININIDNEGFIAIII